MKRKYRIKTCNWRITVEMKTQCVMEWITVPGAYNPDTDSYDKLFNSVDDAKKWIDTEIAIMKQTEPTYEEYP